MTDTRPMPMCPMAETCKGMMDKPGYGLWMMLPGVALIAVGVLIILYPQILAWLVAAALICMLASAEPCAEFDASIEVGQPIYLDTVWNVRVQGNAPGGATSRLQVTAERCHAFAN